jgi:hypothetical protein
MKLSKSDKNITPKIAATFSRMVADCKQKICQTQMSLTK